MILGAQFFTFREKCQTLEGLEESMKRVSEMGIRAIQLSGVCKYDPEWAAEKAAKYGLEIVLTHNPYDNVVGKTDEIIDFHKKLNCKNIGIGTMPGWEITQEKYEKFVKEMTVASQKIHDNGLQFMYHNHNIEYQVSNGKRYIDRLVEDFPSELLNLTYDTYWGQHAGADPAKAIRDYKGHIKVVHFKDMIAYVSKEEPGKVEHRIAAIGEGNMNYDSIIQACLDTGVEYGLIELDDCYGEDPFDAMRRSYEFLKKYNIK